MNNLKQNNSDISIGAELDTSLSSVTNTIDDEKKQSLPFDATKENMNIAEDSPNPLENRASLPEGTEVSAAEPVNIIKPARKSKQVKKATLLAEKMKGIEEKVATEVESNSDKDVSFNAEEDTSIKDAPIWKQLAYIQRNLRCPKSRFNKEGKRGGFPYRSLGDVQQTVDEWLNKTGCALVARTECDANPAWTGDVTDSKGHVNPDFRIRCRAEVTLINGKGESINATGYAYEPRTIGDLFPQQVSAATQNYAVKQALIHLFNICDNDVNIEPAPEMDSIKPEWNAPKYLHTGSKEWDEVKKNAREYSGDADNFIAELNNDYDGLEQKAEGILRFLVESNKNNRPITMPASRLLSTGSNEWDEVKNKAAQFNGNADEFITSLYGVYNKIEQKAEGVLRFLVESNRNNNLNRE